MTATAPRMLAAVPPIRNENAVTDRYADTDQPPLQRARERFRLLDREALDLLPEPTESVAGVLPARGALVVFTGSRGLGKSLLALSLAGSMSCDLDYWHSPEHKIIETGPVLYVSREGFHGVPNRVRAWEIATGQRLDNVMWMPQPLDLKRGEDAYDLALLAADVKAVMVIVDSARATGAGKEDTDDMGAYVHGLERVARGSGALVMTMHNTGHDDTRGRGSTLLPDAADTVLHLQGGRGPNDIRTLRHQKHRDGDMLDGLRFKFRKVEGTHSGLLHPITASDAQAATREERREQIKANSQRDLMTKVCEALQASPTPRSRRQIEDTLRSLGTKFTGTNMRDAITTLQAEGTITTSPHSLISDALPYPDQEALP